MLDEPVQALQTYRAAFGHYAIIREEEAPKYFPLSLFPFFLIVFSSHLSSFAFFHFFSRLSSRISSLFFSRFPPFILFILSFFRQPEPKLGAGSVHSAGTADTRTTHRRTTAGADDILSFVIIIIIICD